MRHFFKSFLASFLWTSVIIFTIHNYNIYAQSFDRTVAEISKNKAYAEYLPILQAQISDMTQGR